ncbi:cytochrome c [Exilibacterium tricleocarpae]|uniref:Cytochrome c n=1 Tax=Exilibacterium tricleocarpae TaxID=2591008 RepID=A0A545TAI7_9GAMM|nr:cytochrome c [Exilibacterium tricleocarpae]TQV74231.1 cytochrome c [Exilibacterium tricleocarpae]
MKIDGRFITIAGVFSVLFGCSTAFNPLDEYEALEPSTILEAPVPLRNNPDTVKGRYLVEILGCATCHTDGALVGQPNAERRLAGSRVGIAYTSPFEGTLPGIVYPANLTPDPETGIGAWEQEQLVRMIKTGISRHGSRRLPVMPWPAYAKLSEEDARAIAAYLLSLEPVAHEVPEHVWPGQRSRAPYVHFGTYRSK